MSGEGPGQYSVTVDAEPEALSDLHELIARVADDRPAIDRFEFDMLETAVIELAGNAVEHGRPPGEVVLTLTVAVSDDHIDATLRDNAERFDEDPAQAELPSELAEGGRGLPLAHLSVDSLTHHFDNGNVWTLSRRFTRDRT